MSDHSSIGHKRVQKIMSSFAWRCFCVLFQLLIMNYYEKEKRLLAQITKKKLFSQSINC